MAIHAEDRHAVARHETRVDVSNVRHDELRLAWRAARRPGAHHDVVARTGQGGFDPAREHQVRHEDENAGHRETSRLQAAPAPEVLPDALRTAPHLNHLRATLSNAPDHHLAL